MVCHPERSLARFLRQTQSKDLQFVPVGKPTRDRKCCDLPTQHWRDPPPHRLLFVLGFGVALNLSRPAKKSKQLSFFFPEQVPEIKSAHGVGTLARVGLKSPSQIGAAPRSQPITARRVPEKSDLFA